MNRCRRWTLALAVVVAIACSIPALAQDTVQESRSELANAARKDLERAREGDPGNPAIVFRLARIEAFLAHDDAALEYLRQLVSMAWDLGIDRDGFPGLQGNQEFEHIVETLSRRAPKLIRSKQAFVLPERDLMPENVAFDPTTGRFFVGSINKRKIVVVDRDRSISDFVGPEHGMLSVLGMKVDDERRGIWVVANGAPMVPGTPAE